MTDNPEHFLPGDIVERTGETVLFGFFILAKGERYPVAETDERGFLMFDGCEDAAFNPRGFKLIERPERPANPNSNRSDQP